MGRLGPNFMALVGLALAWASIFKAQAGPKYALSRPMNTPTNWW